MKKIFLSLLLFASAIVLASGKTYAYTNNAYVLDALTINNGGLTITVEEATNVITIDGTATSALIHTLNSNFYAANTNGSSLDPLKHYAVVYEYMSGSMTGSGDGSAFKYTSTSYGSTIGLNIKESNYTKARSHLITPNDFESAYISFPSDTVLTSLTYKLSFIEIADFETSDVTPFTTLTSITQSGMTLNFTSNTVTLTGSTFFGQIDITPRINPDILNPAKHYLIAFKYVSGSLGSGSTLKIGYDVAAKNEVTMSNSKVNVDQGVGYQAPNDIYIGATSTGTLTNLTFEVIIHEIELIEEVQEPSVPLFDDFSSSSGGVYLAITDGNLFNLNGTPSGSMMFTGLKDFSLLENGKTYRLTYEYVSGSFQGSFSALSINGPEYALNVSGDDYLTSDAQIIVPWSQSITSIWVAGSAAFTNFNYRIYVEDITLDIRTLTFDSQGGSTVSDVIFVTGDVVAAPATPTKPGNDFLYWSESLEVPSAFDFNASIDADTTLYAIWESNGNAVYTITFDSNGGSALSDVIVEDGQSIDSPTAPTRTGYTFGGWFSDEALTTMFEFEVDLITADTTLYAKWLPVSGGGTQLPADETNSMTYVWIGLGAVLIVVALGASSSKKKGSKGKRR